MLKCKSFNLIGNRDLAQSSITRLIKVIAFINRDRNIIGALELSFFRRSIALIDWTCNFSPIKVVASMTVKYLGLLAIVRSTRQISTR